MSRLTHEPMLCAGCGRPLAQREKNDRICSRCSFTQGLRRFCLSVGILW